MDALIILGCLLIVLDCPCIRSRLAVCLPCCNGRPGAVVVSYGVWSDYGVSIITTLWEIMNFHHHRHHQNELSAVTHIDYI